MKPNNLEIEEIEETEEKEEKSTKAVFFRILKAFIALILLVGIIYFSGLREYFFFSKTSPDENVNQLEAVSELEELTLPVNVLIIKEDSLGSERKEEGVKKILENTRSILNQAEISLELEKITKKEVNEEEIDLILKGDFNFLPIDENQVNIIFLKKLNGLNGVAYSGKNTILIADYTAGKDYRTLAHEIGHVLGLSHKDNYRYIMTQGSTGLLFSEEEIIKMRQKLNEKF